MEWLIAIVHAVPSLAPQCSISINRLLTLSTSVNRFNTAVTDTPRSILFFILIPLGAMSSKLMRHHHTTVRGPFGGLGGLQGPLFKAIVQAAARPALDDVYAGVSFAHTELQGITLTLNAQ